MHTNKIKHLLTNSLRRCALHLSLLAMIIFYNHRVYANHDLCTTCSSYSCILTGTSVHYSGGVVVYDDGISTFNSPPPFRPRWVSVFHGTHRQSEYYSRVSNPEQLKKIMRLRFGILAVICNRYANWKVCLLLAYNRQVRYVLWNIGKQYPWVSWKSFHQVNRGSDKHITKNARDKTEILLRHSNAIKQWKPTT